MMLFDEIVSQTLCQAENLGLLLVTLQSVSLKFCSNSVPKVKPLAVSTIALLVIFSIVV